jgi:hypothetical protein
MSADLAQPHPFAANAVEARAQAAPATRVPWYIWAGSLAVTSASIGGHWDVAWHRSIGRDTFWTPAHMAIYACGVIAGITYRIFIQMKHGTTVETGVFDAAVQ